MQIHVKTGHSPDGMIVSEIQDERLGTIERRVLMAQDQQIRQSLIDLGWTPPPTTQEGLTMQLVFEKWAADRGLNLDTYNGHYISKATQDFLECWQRAWLAK